MRFKVEYRSKQKQIVIASPEGKPLCFLTVSEAWDVMTDMAKLLPGIYQGQILNTYIADSPDAGDHDRPQA